MANPHVHPCKRNPRRRASGQILPTIRKAALAKPANAAIKTGNRVIRLQAEGAIIKLESFLSFPAMMKNLCEVIHRANIVGIDGE